MITLKYIRKLLAESNVRIVVVDHDIPLCMPAKRTIFLPKEFMREGLSPDEMRATILSITHELQHIIRTTFEINRIARTRQEQQVFNTLEDLRLDIPIIEKYGLKDAYQKAYNIKGKTFKARTPWYIKVTYVLLLHMLGYSTDMFPDIQTYIDENYLVEYAKNIINHLNLLEKDHSEENYNKCLILISTFAKRIYHR